MNEWYCNKCGKVFSSMNPKCCGDVVEFDILRHIQGLISRSNAWIAIWDEWKDNPLVEEIAEEFTKTGCYSSARILNEAFIRMTNNKEKI